MTTVVSDAATAAMSTPTADDSSDDVIETDEADVSLSPSYPEHVKQA